MFEKSDRFPIRRDQQAKERQERVQRRSSLREERVQELKRRHRQSWIRPWLHACRHIRAYPVDQRGLIFHHFIPLKKLPKLLAEAPSRRRIVTPELKSGSPRTIQTMQREPSEFSIVFTTSEPSSPTSASIKMAALVPIPAVPIAMQMGQAGDRISNVSPLPTFSGWPDSDLDHHMSAFLTACIANNGRTEEIWLRWLPATFKDTTFEWYNRQPVGHFPNWTALRDEFLAHFRPIGFEDRMREQLLHSRMMPGE